MVAIVNDLAVRLWAGLGHITFTNILLYLVLPYLVYWVVVFIYRISLHPLAKFPGPKLAGATFWYEFYYDIWPRRYRYTWKIKELHDKYGPIVRINPIHIHIYDPDYLDEIYASGKHKRDRDPWFHHAEEQGMMAWSLLQTMSHERHRMRRAALNPFFSKRAIQQLEAVLADKAEVLTDRLSRAHAEGAVVNLNYAVAALSLDMATSYALGYDGGNLRREDWGADWLDAFQMVGKLHPLGRHFKTLVNAGVGSMSPRVVGWFSPQMALVARKLQFPLETMRAAVADRAAAAARGEQRLAANSRTVFAEILDSDLPPEEKTAGRLNAEAGSVLGGVETTTRSMGVILYFLVEQPDVLARLRAELRGVMATPHAEVTTAALEALPYFSAIIAEGLRISHGVVSRSPRIATEEDLQYKQWVIPRGTPVMQSMFLHHTHPRIFPDPMDFKPERWLEDPQLKPRYAMYFGRGSRACLGMNLAYSEMYLTIAKIVSRFDLELYETIRERDIDVSHDCFIGATRMDSPGIHIKVVREHTLWPEI